MDYKKEEFDFENSHYTLVPIVGEYGCEVRVLKNDKTVPWKYSVDFDTAIDFRQHIGLDTVDSLIRQAKAYILEKRFEPLLATDQGQ